MKKKLNLATNLDYVPSVWSTQDIPHMNEGVVARFEHLKRRHSTQQANEKVNNPTQPALVAIETKREHGDKKEYSPDIPCEVSKFENTLCIY